MKPNERIKLHIETNAQDGRGIARMDGLVIFVSGAIEGETVLAKIYTVHKTYATAETLEIIKPSPFRAESFCSVSAHCGGCPFAHIQYGKQLKIKEKTVSDALLRIGNFDITKIDISKTVGMDSPFRYRNKMVFPVGKRKGKAVGGFYAKRSHDVIPLTDCLSGERAASIALSEVVSFLNKQNIAPYDERTKKGSVRRVFVRTGFRSRELMIVLSSATEKIKDLGKLIQDLVAQDYEGYTLKSIILNIHEKADNLVLGEKNITLWGEETICDTLMGLSFSISPHSFFQVNPIQTEVLYSTALSLAGINEQTTVLDVYCGIGTISLCAAKTARQVIGVEIVEKAISDAKENAKKNHIENAAFYCGAAEDVVPKLLKTDCHPDVVILDPPRKGSDEKTLSAILSAKPDRIVYVSCNPASLARDARFLADGGYRLTKVIPVDMFPNTEHVESVALLCREAQEENEKL